MAMTLKQWAAAITTPEQQKQRDAETARAMVNDAREKARISAPYRESYARGLAEFERAVAESLKRQQERRQGRTPDAANAESTLASTLTDEHEDIELHCATCDSENITLGARHGADEFGVEDSEDTAWCWDCEEFVEYGEFALPASVLRRILEAVAA